MHVPSFTGQWFQNTNFVIYYHVTQQPVQVIVSGAILLHDYKKNYKAIRINYDYVFSSN